MIPLVPEDQASSSRKGSASYLPMLGYAALALAVIATAYFSFWRIEGMLEQEKLNDLGAIADTKVGQIRAWRDLQERVGVSFSGGSLVAEEFDQWQKQGRPSGTLKYRIRQLLSELQYVNDYRTVTLLDEQGVARLSANGDYVPDAEEVMLAAQVRSSRKAVFTDIHQNSDGSEGLNIDLMVPLTMPDRTGRVVGTMLMVIDPDTYLFPLVQSWPAHSGSAETLLLRREGNQVRFLSGLHFDKSKPLSLRVPLDRQDLPAAMAARGETGTTEGMDYRGVAVVAAMRAIPDSPWFMVAKIDRAEIFAPVVRLKAWTAGIGLVLLVLGGAWLNGIRAKHKLIMEQRDAALEREMLVKHFEYLTRYANDMIVVTDETGRFVEVNERMQQAYGYTREELLQMRISDLRRQDEDPALLRNMLEQLKERGELRYEGIGRRKDGTLFPIEVAARVIETQGTRYRYLHGIIRDITERKQAEEALRKSEAMLQESQRMARIGSWELDLVNNVLSWSDENYRIFEIDPTRFAASYEAFLGIVHPDDRTMVNQTYASSVQDRKPYDIVHRLLFPDQRTKYVREWCETHYDQEGRPIRSVGTTQDVTEQKLAERLLIEQRNFTRSMVDNAPLIIWVADVNKGDTYPAGNFFNKRWYDFTGHAEKDALVSDWINHVHPDDAGRCHDTYDKAYRQMQPFKLEYRLQRHDGVYRWMLDSGFPHFSAEGDLCGFVGTCLDITERKQYEEMRAEKEHASRVNIAGEMAAGLAHELSQPLTACGNYLGGCLRRMDKDDWDREGLHQAVQLAHRQAERAGKIINHLKEMVRREEHERVPINVNWLVRDVMSFLEDEVKHHGISIRMSLSPLPQIMGCKVEIEQVLLNLYKNAIEAMRSSQRRELHVSTHIVASDEIRVTVSDSGSGIPPAAMESLFQPFHSSKRQGLGLGLSICRSFVENHGGRIWADPQREFGAEFCFTLPLEVDHE